jgi:hypothetical protein
MSAYTVFIPFIAIVLVVVGYYLGHMFRDTTHSMIPFNEPLSYILLAISLAPLFVEAYFPQLAFVDPFDPEVLAVFLGFWVGYIIGYMQNKVDLLYVGVHNIIELEQDVHPIVRYTNKQGQSCWQPQGFKEICKTVFFGVHNPLQLSGNVYRTRHVSIKSIVIKLQADAVDVAGLEINESEKVVFRIFGHEVKMKVEGRKYQPAPNCADAPYDWYLNAMKYEDLFTEYAELQVQAAEAKAAIQGAQIKGGASVLNALALRNPSNIAMDALGDDFETFIKNRSMKKNVRRATSEQQNGPMEVAND